MPCISTASSGFVCFCLAYVLQGSALEASSSMLVNLNELDSERNSEPLAVRFAFKITLGAVTDTSAAANQHTVLESLHI